MSLTVTAMMAMQSMQDAQSANNMVVQGMSQMKEEEDRVISKMNEDMQLTRVEVLKGNANAMSRLSFS